VFSASAHVRQGKPGVDPAGQPSLTVSTIDKNCRFDKSLKFFTSPTYGLLFISVGRLLKISRKAACLWFMPTKI